MRKRKYSLLGLIREATEPDQKHDYASPLVITGEAASDNSAAMLVKKNSGLSTLISTLGSNYKGSYYIWKKAKNLSPKQYQVGSYYKKGSGDPYTYEYLGEAEGGKKRYRVISGPINNGTYKSGKFKGKKIGTRPIGAVFTMGGNLDPVPKPEPSSNEGNCIKINQLYKEQKSKLEKLKKEEVRVTGKDASPNANTQGSRNFTEDLEDILYTLRVAEDLANKGKQYRVAQVGDAITKLAKMKATVKKVEDGSTTSGTNSLVQRYMVFTSAESEQVVNDLTDIFNLFFFGIEDIGYEYVNTKPCNENPLIKKFGTSIGNLNQTGEGAMEESFSRGELYRRRYWGRY